MAEIVKDNVELTPLAMEKAKGLQASVPEYQGKSLRLYLDGKGCDGFYYGVTFDQASADDLKFLACGIELVVDPDTYEFVKGSTIDWADLEIGSGFLVHNPNQKAFRGKFFKRSKWREKLEPSKLARDSNPG